MTQTNIPAELRELTDALFDASTDMPDGVYKTCIEAAAALQKRFNFQPKALPGAAAVYGDENTRLRQLVESLLARLNAVPQVVEDQLRVQRDTLEYLLARQCEKANQLHSENVALAGELDRYRDVALPVLERKQVCCFDALTEHMKDGAVDVSQLKFSHCGCCKQKYLIGYSRTFFRTEGKKKHSKECEHTSHSCSDCRSTLRLNLIPLTGGAARPLSPPVHPPRGYSWRIPYGDPGNVTRAPFNVRDADI